MIPGAIIGVYIFININNLDKVPKSYMTLNAFLSYLQSIAWIKFSSGFIVDLFRIGGFIIRVIPQDLISLITLSLGNRIGDVSTDYYVSLINGAEMAVTATFAGPIFNILVGQGLSTLFTILRNDEASIFDSYVSFSVFN